MIMTGKQKLKHFW